MARKIRHEYEGPRGPEAMIASTPELPVLIDVVSERDVRRSAFFSTEMGRRYFERLQAGEPVDLADLEASAEPKDRKAFTRVLSWGVEETLGLIQSMEGVEVPGDLAEWLLLNRKAEVMALRDKAFGESQ